MKAVIIDDEKSARENIKIILKEYFNEIEICGEDESVSGAVEVITSVKPDIIFLDIDIIEGTGFDVLQKINFEKYKIVFITAFQEHAIRAIKFSAFDYILKPFKASELVQTINKIIRENVDEHYALKFDAIFSNFNSAYPELKKIVLKTSDKIYVVNIKDILYCASENNYTTFFLNTGGKILVSKPIKKYDELFAGLNFMRVHQSYLINLNYIQHFDKYDGGMLIMTNNQKIPVSSRQRTNLLKYFDSLSN